MYSYIIKGEIVGVQNRVVGALAHQGEDVVGVLRRGAEAGVLEVVDAGSDPATDFLGAVRVRDHEELALVRLVDDRVHLLHRHLVLVDQLDQVDAGVRELRTFARASSTPLTPQRNASVPGYGSCCRNGPET